jgi:amidohydrolase
MGGEDFSFFLQKSKGCFFVLGAGREDSAPVHHPGFDFNEDILLLGVETYCRVASKLLVDGDRGGNKDDRYTTGGKVFKSNRRNL